MLEIIILLISALACFVSGLIVVTRNPNNKINILFGIFAFSALLLGVSNHFSLQTDDRLFYIRTVIFSAVLLTSSLYFLIFFLRDNAKTINTYRRIAIYYSALVAVLNYTPLVFRGLTSPPDPVPVPAPGAALFFLHLVVSLAATSILLIGGIKKSSGKKRMQLLYVLVGLIPMVVLSPLTGFVLPILMNNPDFVIFNVIYIAFLVIMIGIAITKHGLFDIKLIVARSVAYLCSLGTILFISVLILFSLSSRLSQWGVGQNILLWIYVLFTVILALAFRPIKAFFDRVTSKIFYRDAYDTQEILDRVSGIIVGNVDPHKIQRGALAALADALKPTHTAFLLINRGGVLRKGDMMGQQWDMHNPVELHSTLKKIGKKLTVYDELEERESKLRSTLRSEDIGIVSPLVTKDEAIGYLVLGPKKSGNIYNSQDMGLLNIASNELAVALQNAQRFEEIQAFNITLQEKITEATRELKSTNKKLIALDEAKDEFISMASHQLRTPLTSIKGYISMLLEGDLGRLGKPQEKALKEAFGSSQRMVYLIADFLNVSRIKTGKFVIEPKEVDLPQIVTEELTQLREMAGSRDLKLVYEQPEVFPRVQLDDNKIRQVMMNMVDNAIYYTPSGGTITIQLYSTGDEIIFKVIDSGIGVPKAEQHKLFTKFYRAGNARKSRPDGTGLGLFMAQKIIVEQGGAIIFESTEGKGSTFGFRFPLAKVKV